MVATGHVRLRPGVSILNMPVTDGALLPPRLPVVVHGHRQVVFAFGDLRRERDVLDLDIAQGVQGVSDPPQERGYVALALPGRIRLAEAEDGPLVALIDRSKHAHRLTPPARKVPLHGLSVWRRWSPQLRGCSATAEEESCDGPGMRGSRSPELPELLV
jgi:hypothetical protein